MIGIKATYSVSNRLVLSPDFQPNKRVKKLREAKEKLFDLKSQLQNIDMEIKVGQFKESLTRDYVLKIVEKQEKLVNDIRQTFKYQRNNRASDGLSLSTRAKQSIKDSLYWLYRKKLSVGQSLLWYTFTIPPRKDGLPYKPVEDDKPICDAFVKLLENLRRNHGLQDYIWISERQDGKRKPGKFESSRGAIHFHCLFIQKSSQYLHVQDVNLYWLGLLENIGYEVISNAMIDKHIKLFSSRLAVVIKTPISKIYSPVRKDKDINELNAYISQLEHYRQRRSINKICGYNNYFGLNHQSLLFKVVYNPVDCEKIDSLKKLGVYMTKYITKNQDKFYCRVWSQTRFFSRLKVKVNCNIDDLYHAGFHHYILKRYDFTKILGNHEVTFTTFYLSEEVYENECFNAMLSEMMKPPLIT